MLFPKVKEESTFQIIDRCLVTNPEKRISASEVLDLGILSCDEKIAKFLRINTNNDKLTLSTACSD